MPLKKRRPKTKSRIPGKLLLCPKPLGSPDTLGDGSVLRRYCTVTARSGHGYGTFSQDSLHHDPTTSPNPWGMALPVYTQRILAAQG